MNGLRLKNPPTQAANARLKKMWRLVPGGSGRQQNANTAPTEKSDTGPAAEIAIRRRRGSNHASDVSTNAYGKIATSLSPARSIRRPNDAMVRPCAVS